MNNFRLILKQNKLRLIFTLIGFVVAGTVLLFSLFYIEAIKHSLSENIKLKPNEYHLFVNEKRFTSIPTNYYLELDNIFDEVVPFNKHETFSNGDRVIVIGTNLNTNKLILSDRAYDIDTTNISGGSTVNPKVYVLEKYYDENNLIIKIDNKDFEVIGYFSNTVLENEIHVNTVIYFIDIFDYAEFLDSETKNNESGIEKPLIENYYIKSRYSENETIEKIKQLYNDPFIGSYINSHESLLNNAIQDFLMFANIAILFFILISIFSFINIFVAISLMINERRHYYAILTMVGMKVRDLKLMILLEIGTLSLIAGLMSLVGGYIVSWIGLSSMGLSMISIPISNLLLIFMVIFLVPVIHTLMIVQFIKYKNISKLSLA